MSYQALYRVWRPQRFSDLVGQQIVSFKLRAQGIANLVLLPSRPDTVRKDALALRPNGKKDYTLFFGH